jgi:hypothetical protein
VSDLLLAQAPEVYGLDRKWAADLLEKYGPQALDLAIQGLWLGFSTEIIRQALDLGGQAFLEVLVALAK